MAGKRTTKPVTFNAKTSQLRRDLKKRGPVNFTLAEFREWLLAKRISPALWKCEYSNEFIVIADVSIDHKNPLTLGGVGTLDNLAVCTRRLNRIKNAIPYDQFIKLKRTVEEEWPKAAAQDLWERLAAKPPAAIYGGLYKKKGSKAAQFVAEFNRRRQ